MFLLLLVLLPTFTFVVLYLVGRVKPLDQVYMFFCGLFSVPLKDIADLLAVFKEKQFSSDTKHLGLRTVMILIALPFTLLAVIADSYNTLDAISALFGDTSLALPTFPPIFGFSMGFLYLSLCVVFGGLFFEKFIPQEARIFTIPDGDKEKAFEKFISRSFWLSLCATVAFFADRAVFLNNPDSILLGPLQFTTFILLGILMPLLGVVAIYLIALGFQAILSLIFTVIWFVASVSSHCLEYIHKHYLELSLGREVQRNATKTDTTVEAIPENEPVTALPSPAPFAGRKREDFLISGPPVFVESASRTLDELAEKAPHRYQELLEYLPKIVYDPSLNQGNSWYALSDGRFGFTGEDYEQLRWVIGHETGHNVEMEQHNDRSEDAANEYAHKVTAEIEAYQKEEVA